MVNLWPESGPSSSTESGFKTMIITFFILTLTKVNEWLYGPWPSLTLGRPLVEF
jgi:hypothetical protein